jgi:hypothetical protein
MNVDHETRLPIRRDDRSMPNFMRDTLDQQATLLPGPEMVHVVLVAIVISFYCAPIPLIPSLTLINRSVGIHQGNGENGSPQFLRIDLITEASHGFNAVYFLPVLIGNDNQVPAGTSAV